jgi:hypothetical protein
MKRIVLSLVLLVILVLPSGARAQGGLQLEFLSVELWSEYDQPSMLVINEFALAPGTTLPVDVKWRFPNEANLVAVAYEADGDLLNFPFESSAEQGDWQTISLKLDSYNTYHIEYYQPLARAGNVRSFAFKWIGDYGVSDLRLTMNLPPDSVDIDTTPVLSQIDLQPNLGLLVGTASKSDLKMGSSYQFNLQYARDSDALADPNQASQVNPSEPLSTDTDGRISVNNLPWIIGGIGIALIGIALFIYWRSAQTNSNASKRPRGRRQEARAREEGGQPAYCHECGTRTNPGDRFCRTCGSRLRNG